ncbi:MAG: site-specific integrase [Devosia sp.]|nr:site-specific integrase [Devosia sp.]
MAGKQAKVLTKAQIGTVLTHLESTRNPLRDRAMFLLSLRAGLRAKEIAEATWFMVLDAEGRVGDTLAVEDHAAKRGSGRTIPLANDLQRALEALHEARWPRPAETILYTEREPRFSAATVAQWFFAMYRRLGFVGCSSHSGRRTFLTQAARKISLCGGSLRDVQRLAGHADLSTTAVYLDCDPAAARKVVNMI